MTQHQFTRIVRFGVLALALLINNVAPAQNPDRTSFQSGAHYDPKTDIGTDTAIVYGAGKNLAERVAQWRAQGYAYSFMTGISWGGYGDYYGEGDAFKKDEVQTRKDGSLRMHGANVGYNVPTPEYVEYIKNYITPAVDLDPLAICLEEPEFWADTGWSAGFKRLWQDFYGESWQEPDSSPDAQYRASKLKYELYYDALSEVFRFCDERAAKRNHKLDCIVPTHSLINYAHWGIVSPESHLMDIPEADGYIAQVWTGTSRTPNLYDGKRAERTFETAFLEYGQMLGMVRPSGRKVWFLHDPIEDNPDRSWEDYKRNYEATVVASLLWPEVSRFEVMPWPNRIFQGTYPRTDLAGKDTREGIPADYATEVLVVINALNDMNQTDIKLDMGMQGVGVIVSDTLMFQRANPTPSDHALSHFYGLALPLVMAGVGVEPVQLEHIIQPEALNRYKVLLLTYEGQKPLKPEYHVALADWVRRGGSLIYVGDESDPYHNVREWWNEQGANARRPSMDLMEQCGLPAEAPDGSYEIGSGVVRVVREHPANFARKKGGADRLRSVVSDVLQRKAQSIAWTNYLRVQRGPYLVASVLAESISDQPLELRGTFVDVFDPALPVVRERSLQPGERVLFYDLNWLDATKTAAKVVAAGARVRDEQLNDHTFTFTLRGPEATTCRARIRLPDAPSEITSDPPSQIQQVWDEQSRTLWIELANIGANQRVAVKY